MKKIISLLLVLSLGLLVVGCSSITGDSSLDSDSAELQMLLTDAPVDGVDELNVTIDGIDINSDARGWETLSTEKQTFDLLKLQGVTAKLLNKHLEPGTYNQIRLYVTDAEVVIDGNTKSVTIPSADQTGLKLTNSFTIEKGVPKALLLDFDARKSLKDAKQGYKLTPTIRLVERIKTGDLKGTEVLNQDGNVATGYVVKIYKNYETADEKVITSTIIKKDGSFKILGLQAEDYTMVISNPNTTTTEPYTKEVSITAEKINELKTINLKF
ncbi:hypothetical protein Halha_1339 [Halobacteroides halobius DSM 5150]|uniref:DUF4382 domain-containing protein n=1 Tax=Halobacteroides halobius (strain ATCC 35273 / DSM 5150 / MD-1) TaxID=748449 RepID=L0KAB4_HALHC|nr:DUF4382 domain-containing protein [Halobacteroides halobius]AGB41284.1 hypothetical protein Halha_1339 [Halobacteroides halobius DSM 5150]